MCIHFGLASNENGPKTKTGFSFSSLHDPEWNQTFYHSDWFLAQVEEWVKEVHPLDPGSELFKGRNGSCGAEQGLSIPAY